MNPSDMWGTPRCLVDACIWALEEKYGIRPSAEPTFMEPACGLGVWIHALMAAGYYHIDGIEADIDLVNVSGLDVRQGDALKDRWIADCTIGNPPFSLSLEFVAHCKQQSKIVAFIQPMNMLEPCDNRGDYVKGLRYVFPFRRMKFESLIPREKTTTDPRPFALFVWQRGYTGAPEIDYSIARRLMAKAQTQEVGG